jgi:Flp pilus assembly protein TadG
VRRPRPLQSRRRGATLLLFLLVMVPFAMLSMMLAADLTRLIDAQRQASNVAQAAATAGSLQYRDDTSRLDLNMARTVANATAEANFDAGALRYGVNPLSVTIPAERQVSVTISYQLDGLIIGQFFLGQDQQRRSVTRVAEVCRPGETGVAGGYCARPRTLLP